MLTSCVNITAGIICDSCRNNKEVNSKKEIVPSSHMKKVILLRPSCDTIGGLHCKFFNKFFIDKYK